MKFQLKMLFLGTLAGGLCSCSVLGERQESTKKDLDESNITQMRLMPKKDAAATALEEEKKAIAEGKTPVDSAMAVTYVSRFLQDDLDAQKYVADKNINFNQVTEKDIDGTKYTMPGDVDRLSLFCGLGGKINAKLKKVTADDNFKEELKYDAKAVEDVQAKIGETEGCEGNIHEVFADGTATFNLNDVDLDLIARNTKDATGNLHDYLIKEINKEQKKLNPNNPVEITKILFKNLPQTLIDQFTASFDPNLNTVTITVKKNIQYCTPESGKAVAYVMENGKLVPATKITVSDDKKTITIVTTTKIKREELGQMPLHVGNGEQQIKLEDLKFSEQKISIISNNEFEQETTYTLEVGDPVVKTENVDKPKNTEPVKDKGQPNTETKTTTTTENPTNTTTADLNTTTTLPLNPKSSSSIEANNKSSNKKLNKNTNSKTKTNASTSTVTTSTAATTTTAANTTNKSSTATTTTQPIPFYLSQNVSDHPEDRRFMGDQKFLEKKLNEAIANRIPEEKEETTAPAGPVTTTATKPAAAKPTAPASIAAVPAIAQAFPAKSNSAWFSLKMNKHAANFFTVKDGKAVYEPGKENYAFINNSAYNTKYLTDGQVDTLCSAYPYSRTMNFKTKFTQPKEANTEKYFVKDGVAISYKKVLFEQFDLPSTKTGERPTLDEPVEQLVKAALDTPKGINEQNWDIKFCFGEKEGFTAFWSSDDSRTSSYTSSNSGVNLTLGKADHWLQIIKDADTYNGDVPKGFNANRGKRKPSNFAITCTSTTECVAKFQIKVQRYMDPHILMAYINRKYITGQMMIKSQKDILDSIESGFREKPNRNEIVTYGGFKFDPTKKGADTAKYISPTTLSTMGVVPADEYNPNVTAHVLFPGDNSELYLNIIVPGA